MIYPYRCDACGHTWEVIKRVAEIDNAESCPTCSCLGVRFIASRQTFYNEKVEDAYYCPALGTIVKNKAHRNKIAKDRGLIEIGNDDPPSNAHKYDALREKNARDRYREFFEPISIRSARC